MINAVRYSLLGGVAMLVLVVFFGVVHWIASTSLHSQSTLQCSTVIQYCGQDARVSVYEMLYLWLGLGLLPSANLQLFMFFQMKAVMDQRAQPRLSWFLLASIATILLQCVLAFSFAGMRYFIADFSPGVLFSNLPLSNFMQGFIVISASTVGILALTVFLLSSRMIDPAANKPKRARRGSIEG